jgi:hypothetical protein
MYTATVLAIKQYPVHEIGILLHGTPVVVSLRDVKMAPVDGVKTWPSVEMFSGRGVGNIEEGCVLKVYDIGTWNVNTSALHGARVTLSDVCPAVSVVPTSGLPTSVLPTRRKWTSME